MKKSNELSNIIDVALGKVPVINSIEMSEEEKVVKFLEHIGLDEGVDFCIDEGEVMIPDDMELDDEIKMFESKKFKKYPNIEFKMVGEEVHVTSPNTDFDSIKIPQCVYQFAEAHIK